MKEFLARPGFLGTAATLGGDLSQLMAMVFTTLFIIGWVQARKRSGICAFTVAAAANTLFFNSIARTPRWIFASATSRNARTLSRRHPYACFLLSLSMSRDRLVCG